MATHNKSYPFASRTRACVDYLKYLCQDVLSTNIGRFAFGIAGIAVARKVLDLVRRKWYKLPPGPVGIPFFGMAHDFAKPTKLIEYAKYYGPIYLANVGFSQVCFINDYKLMQQTFGRKEFVGRDFGKITFEKGFWQLDGNKEWHNRRQLFIKNMISQLNGKKLSTTIEKIVQNKVFPIIDNKCKLNEKWDIRNESFYITFAVTYCVTFGLNSSLPGPNENDFIKFSHLNNEMFAKLLDYLAIRILFCKTEWIKNYMIHKLGMDTTTLAQFKMIENWMNEFDSNINNNTSAIDEMNYKSLYYPTLKNANIDKNKSIADIHTAMAGSIHNTATTLEQGILYLAQLGSEYQNELFNEINKFTNNGDDYNYCNILKSRFDNLPLMSSFIYELLRMHGYTRQTFGRDTNKNTKIGNYILPKGTIFCVSLAAINHNENYWQNLNNNKTSPFVFNPKRFINDKKEFLKQNEMSIFGYGRRDCPGKELAMREIYLLFAILIQRYQFGIPNSFKSSQEYLESIPIFFEDPNTPKIGVSVSLRPKPLSDGKRVPDKSK